MSTQDNSMLRVIKDKFKREKVINLRHGETSQHYYNNEIFRNKVNELKTKLKTNLWLSLRYKNTIQNANVLTNTLKLDVSECQKILDIGCLHNLHTLSTHSANNIKDVGHLRTLKILVIQGNKDIEGIHLLKNLDKLIIPEYYSNKTKKRIKKLKQINKNIKIINLTVNITYG